MAAGEFGAEGAIFIEVRSFENDIFVHLFTEDDTLVLSGPSFVDLSVARGGELVLEETLEPAYESERGECYYICSHAVLEMVLP